LATGATIRVKVSEDRRSVIRATRIVMVLGLAAAASFIGQASAASRTVSAVRCSLRASLKSGNLSSTGILVGSVSCGHPLGQGSYHGRYRDYVVPWPFTGSETGSSKLSFDTGTVRATYKIAQAPISGTAPYHGTFHITGGTGRFKHASGTLRMTCSHRIPPLTDCTVRGPVSGI
jgi:hypothetical protein